MPKYDFSGYATKANLRCSDGRTILPDAFKMNDGNTVPLVWQHQRNDPENILGSATLENRKDGVYCYCKFNDSPRAQHTKHLVEHGDIRNLSIYANQLKEYNHDVAHGNIREVSLVVAGANPGAFIDNLVIQHEDGHLTPLDDEAIIYTGLDIYLEHADSDDDDEDEEDEPVAKKTNTKSRTAQEIFDSLDEDQKNLLYALVGSALADNGGESDEDAEQDAFGGDDYMKHNVFEGSDDYMASDSGKRQYMLTHEDEHDILETAKKMGSFQAALQQFAQEGADALEHGVTDLEILFPEAKATSAQPELLTRRMEWVSKVWNGFKKSPMSRIKSVYADVTMDEARAKGYIKGHRKVEEQFSLLKRVTQPTTIYKKQKFDRDDLIDITDFNFVAWIQSEMRMMLNEELSRAALLGDGRTVGDEDKIDETCIRPIYNEDPMYAMRYDVAISPEMDETDRANAIIEAAVRARKDYRGSGNPEFFTTTDLLNDMMLAKDKIGHRLFATNAELSAALRVKDITEVPVMENVTRTDAEGKVHTLLGIIVNLSDYTIGADRGGAVTMFDDFDIDYNKQIYLIETRLSGSLNRPYSAIILESVEDTKPVKLKVTVPGQKETFYGREANAFQNNILMGSDFLCGKLYHQTGWKEWSGDVNKQEGFYLCLKTELENGDGYKVFTQVINGDSKTEMDMTDDGYCVYRIKDPEKQKIRITVKKDGSAAVVKTYNISNLTLV